MKLWIIVILVRIVVGDLIAASKLMKCNLNGSEDDIQCD